MNHELAHVDDALDRRGRHRTETTELDGLAGKASKEHLIETIEALENHSLVTLRTFRDHDVGLGAVKVLEECGDGLGTIFAVAVHDDHPVVTLEVIDGVAQAGSDGPLMTNGTTESKDVDAERMSS